jgi:DNA-binding transcriptional LysR family regulator
LVRLIVPREMSRSFLCGIVMRFSARFPAIQLEVKFSSETSDLASDDFDLAMAPAGWSESDQIVGAVPVSGWLFASPRYLKAHPAIRDPADLKMHQCIVQSSGADASETWSLVGPRGPEPVVVSGPVHGNDCSFIHQLVLRSTGIAILPATLGLDDLRARTLLRVLPDYEVPGPGLRLVLPASPRLPQRVALFRDALLEAFTRARNSAYGPPGV